MGRSLITFIGLVLFGCAQQSENLMAEAAQVHNLSVKIGEHVEQKIRTIEQYALKETSSTKKELMDSVNSLDQDLLEWKNQLVEVPGNDHDGHHDHAHHEAPADLTPQMILDIQREINRQIRGANR